MLCSFVRFYADTSENGYGASLEDDYNDLQQSSVLASTSIEMQQQSERRKPPLVFVLNLRDNERQSLRHSSRRYNQMSNSGRASSSETNGQQQQEIKIKQQDMKDNKEIVKMQMVQKQNKA